MEIENYPWSGSLRFLSRAQFHLLCTAARIGRGRAAKAALSAAGKDETGSQSVQEPDGSKQNSYAAGEGPCGIETSRHCATQERHFAAMAPSRPPVPIRAGLLRSETEIAAKATEASMIIREM
jgi:hypothetical protein